LFVCLFGCLFVCFCVIVSDAESPHLVGKTSLIRTLAGLWKGEEGELWFPTGMMWIPQRPYVVSGTLRDQVTYPFILSNPTEAENALVSQCLMDAGLERWVNRGLGMKNPSYSLSTVGSVRESCIQNNWRLLKCILFYLLYLFAMTTIFSI
jgi:ABC-type uncharacterized transport system fused permease/ATPase subunit